LGNPAAAALLSRPLEALIGTPFGLPTDISNSTEIDLIQPDGNRCSVEMRASQFQWLKRPALLISLRDITERKLLQGQLIQQAFTDVLTGVSNRRHFIELANQELVRTIRYKHELAIAVIDLDRFKQINDTYGHALGDKALRAFAIICLKHIRSIDIFARLGGDEFVLLFPETGAEQAYQVVERMRMVMTELSIDLDGPSTSLTISAGISTLASTFDSLDMLMNRADRALYRAKEAGRNRVIIEAAPAGSLP
jgi:diguanylate cyclase (GGDEF)-like protein